ncbi:hypothetical protein Q1695_010149 [Nippostrongylus brasiliensis]|nr:hypothetical protein Q1695_010149 [Nippostrongylus brasiliensis]
MRTTSEGVGVLLSFSFEPGAARLSENLPEKDDEERSRTTTTRVPTSRREPVKREKPPDRRDLSLADAE